MRTEDYWHVDELLDFQICKFRFRLRELTTCSCFAAASVVCLECHMAGLNTIETGNELSQPQFEFTGLPMCNLGLSKAGALFLRIILLELPVCQLYYQLREWLLCEWEEDSGSTVEQAYHLDHYFTHVSLHKLHRDNTFIIST